MATKAKYHHYIPACYLKGFTEGGERTSQFLGVPKDGGKSFHTNPNDACKERHYYTVDHPDSLIVEEWYGNKIEPLIGKVIQDIKESLSLPHKDDMHNFRLLLATLFLRVPSFRDWLREPLKIMESMAFQMNAKNKHDFKFNRTDLIEIELNQLYSVTDLLSNRYFQLYVNNTASYNFITSDRPFLHYHTQNAPHFGLNTPNTEICVPITKDIMVIGSNEKLDEGTFEANEQLIGMANFKTLMFSNRFIYSSNMEQCLLVNDELLPTPYRFE